MGYLQFHLHVNKTNEILCASRTWPTLSPVSQWTALKVALKKWHILNKAPGKWERGSVCRVRSLSSFLAILTLATTHPQKGHPQTLRLSVNASRDSVSGISRLWIMMVIVWLCIYCPTVTRSMVMYRLCLSQAQGIVEGKDLVLKQHENFVLCPCDSS